VTFLPGLTDIGTDGRAVMNDVLSENVEKTSRNKKVSVTVILRYNTTLTR